MSSGGFIFVLKLAISCGILYSACFGYMDVFPHGEGDEKNRYTLSGPDPQGNLKIKKRQSISSAELHALLEELTAGKVKELTRNGELRYVTLLERSQNSLTPRLGRRKRSLDYDRGNDESFLSHMDTEHAEERLRLLLQPPLRRRGTIVKTIHLQSSFVPRLGRKRSDESTISANNSFSGQQSGGISGRSQQVVNLNAGSSFTPRLGRSFKGLSRHQRSTAGQSTAQGSW